MLEVNYPPGVTSASHQHPGPTFGYVVSGKVKWAINGEPAKVLEAGQSFFEPMGSVHSTSANASDTEPAKLSVVILSKPGEPLSKPAGKTGDRDANLVIPRAGDVVIHRLISGSDDVSGRSISQSGERVHRGQVAKSIVG